MIKIEINHHEIDKTVAELKIFWRELALCLRHNPSDTTAVSDLLDQYPHLVPYINDEVEDALLDLARKVGWVKL